MVLKLKLNFRPFNVNLKEDNTLVVDNNDIDNWQELIYKLTPGEWNIKKVNTKSIILERVNFALKI